MAIKGISDVDQLPRIGKIRLGVKDKEKGFPIKTDYFVFDPTDKDVIEEFKKIYGDKPKALDILFATDEPESNFPQFMKRYTYGTLVCKGDGEIGQEKQFDKDKKQIGVKEVKCEGCAYAKAGKCKPLASLMFLLPRIPGIGVFQLDTTSRNSIIGVNAGMKLVKTLYKRISGVPLRLLLSPKTVSPDGRAKVIYVISLSIEGTLEKAMKNGTYAPVLEAPKVAILPAPDEEEATDHFPEEEEGEEHDEPPVEEETTTENVPKEELRKILAAQADKLQYGKDQMLSFIAKAFKKKSSGEMEPAEFDLAIKHLAKIILLVEEAKGAWGMAELEENAKKVYKVKSMAELSSVDLEKFAGMIKKGLPK